MAKGNPTVQLRIEPEMRERWTAAALQRGVSLPEFVRGAVEGFLAGPDYQVTMTGGSGASRNTRRAADVSLCRNAQRHVKGVRCGYCHAVP